MKIVELTHIYHAPARDVWDIAVDYACLTEVMRGMVSFDGLPDGRIEPDHSLTVMVSLFGFLPAQPYHMEIVSLDDVGMRFVSSERGAGVKSWRHTLDVADTATGCILTDHIEIDAGRLTWLFAGWARFMYRRRHAPRLRILARRHSGVG